MAELKELECRFSKRYQDVFEDIATLIFCTEIGLSKGVNRRVNQKAIESDPISINEKRFAYQAKYYEASTKLSTHKRDLINSIKGAAEENVTDLFFFLNKNKPDINHETDKEAKYIREIEVAAKERKINLHWWTKSKIESSLDMPKYIHIRDKYFDSDKNGTNITAFYEEAIEIIEECPEDSVYGSISLKDGYIEPCINSGNQVYTVKEFLENWVTKEEKILLIHGAPGHGKTSMCWKAMYDAYKHGWLTGIVNNVFRFSLNPVNTSILAQKSLSFSALLSWGFDRENSLSLQDCHNAMIFFDGYDELVECVGNIEFKEFIKYLKRFQKKTNSHIIITSRSMAVVAYLKDNYISFSEKISAYELQPINQKDQLNWIDKYKKHYPLNSASKTIDWDNYADKFKDIFSKSYYDLLGIPTIFRMVVVAHYLPQNKTSITKMYSELFSLTWSRHSRPIGSDIRCTYTEKSVLQMLQEHALKVYLYDTDTAQTKESLNAPWTFSFYTRKPTISEGENRGEQRMGFLHKSFYQYFLAKEILSWFVKYASDNSMSKSAFKEKLSYLARRKLDKTTLSFLEELYDTSYSSAIYDKAFEKAYEVLKQTDGVYTLLLSKTKSCDTKGEKGDANHDTYLNTQLIQEMSPIERANNIFWNIVTICGICGKPLTKASVNEAALAAYDMSECCLRGAELSNANLRNARLREADLREANLSDSDLRSADFVFANLHGANLSGANLKGADLFGADLRGNFDGADMSMTDLGRANLSGSNLRWADCSRAILNGAFLVQADLRGLNIEDADIVGALFMHAKIHEVDIDIWKKFGVDLSTLEIVSDDD